MADSFYIDKDGNSIDAQDVTSMPTDVNFFDAWALSGTVISIDMEKAKEIFREKIRFERKTKFEEHDAAYMKALETNDTNAQASIAAIKQSLRDAPAHANISSATTIEELKAAWDTTILGDNPYA